MQGCTLLHSSLDQKSDPKSLQWPGCHMETFLCVGSSASFLPKSDVSCVCIASFSPAEVCCLLGCIQMESVISALLFYYLIPELR